MVGETWLSITEASKVLGVHPSTLRRWADAEQVPFTRTHGGHRRFSMASLLALQAEQGRLRHLGGLERRWNDAARSDTRRELKALSGWGRELDNVSRGQFRRLGRDLLDLTTAEISTGEQTASLQKAAGIGAEYARLGRQCGLTLVELTEAVLLASGSLTEAALGLPEVEHLQRSAVQSVMRAIQRITQAVHLAMVTEFTEGQESHEQRAVREPEHGERRGS